VLTRGLATATRNRAQDVSELKRELARWYVDHAGEEKKDDAEPASHRGPPPLPSGAANPAVGSPAPSTVEQPVRRAPPADAPRSRWWLWVAAVAVPLGVGASWGAASLLSANEVIVEVPAPEKSTPAPSAAASAASIDLSEVPLTGESDMATGDPMATCVAGYLPRGAFVGSAPDLGWVCDEPDPRSGATKLHSAVVKGGGGRVTKAMKLMSQLGWYQMAAYSVVYAGCCAEAKPLELPKASDGCPPMASPLSELGAAVVAERDPDTFLKGFQEAIRCEVKANRVQEFRQKGAPVGAEETAFAELVQALREH